ncbi:MAG TPA: hypothetical protein VFW19_04165 [Allosphingosinicella sp.]|nr:hypothetical protein [Allosphingosinicella sp.]
MTGRMFAMAALAALAAATPAAAQWNGGVDIGGLRARIDDGVTRGSLSPDDAAELRSQLRGLVNLQRRYADDGFTGSEREDLRQRAQGLRNEIADAEGEGAPSAYGRYDNRPVYGNGYGGSRGAYGDRTGGGYDTGSRAYGNAPYGNAPYGSYGDRGSGTAPYGNGGYGNGARPDRYGNGQYESDDADRDNGYRNDGRYDRDNADRDDEGDDALRVGDRANGGLYAVPNAYRARFRDGGGVYYRYGAGNVYQIDGRTGVVLRIYPIDR